MRHFIRELLAKHYHAILAASACSISMAGCSPPATVKPATQPTTQTTGEGTSAAKPATPPTATSAAPEVAQPQVSRTATAEEIAQAWLAWRIDEVLLQLRRNGLEKLKDVTPPNTHSQLAELQSNLRKEKEKGISDDPSVQLDYRIDPSSIRPKAGKATAELTKVLSTAMVTVRYEPIDKTVRMAHDEFAERPAPEMEFILPKAVADLQQAKELIAKPEWLTNLMVTPAAKGAGDFASQEVLFVKDRYDYSTSDCQRVEVRVLPTSNPDQQVWELSFVEVLQLELSYSPQTYRPMLEKINQKAAVDFFANRVTLHGAVLNKNEAQKPATTP